MRAIDRLTERIAGLGSPLCVGLDPSPELVPEHLVREFGGNMPGAFLEFNRRIIDAVKDTAAVVKPQIAMYERFGPEGVAAYFRTVLYALSRGFVVIGDIKRGDIANSAKAYADAHLSDDGPDFVTVNPFLGRDSVEPFLEKCEKNGKGVFVLVKTSNPGAAELQDLELADGARLYERVGDMAAGWGAALIGNSGYSSVGAVVGATVPEQGKTLRERLNHTFFLVPGYGTQGGTADDAAFCFDKNGSGAIVNSSRGIIGAWKNAGKNGAENFDEHAYHAAVKARDEINRSVKKAGEKNE